MKLNKIMTNVLKISADEKKSKVFIYGIDKGYVYFSPDGLRMYKIAEKDFLIDLGKAFPHKTPINDPKKMMNDSDAEPAVKTNEVKLYEKFTVIKIKSEKSQAWVNVDYLKDFDTDCTFKIMDEKSPVFVYEYEELVGLILPVKIEEN